MTKTVSVGKLDVGDPYIVVMAGPCSVESRSHTMEMMHLTKEAGADVYRAGAFKPRTNAGEFDGLKEKGLKYLAEAREMYGLPVITEIMSRDDIPMFQEHAIDIYQVGARNAQNFDLLHALGGLKVSVLLKRGGGNKVKEWIGASGHVTSRGNENVILCERGIATIDPEFRNLADITAVAYAKKYSDLPVAFDPSHGTGRRDMVYSASMASVSAGADAVLIEVHDDPAVALTDGKQCILPKELGILVKHARELRRFYIDAHQEYRSRMRGVTSGRVTVYFLESELPKILQYLGLDEKDTKLKPYKVGHRVIQARIKDGQFSRLKQHHGYAVGKLCSFMSRSTREEVPIVSVRRLGDPTTIMTPYSAEAVHEADKKTLDERNPSMRRMELKRRYPTDIVLDAFETYTSPLVLYTVE